MTDLDAVRQDLSKFTREMLTENYLFGSGQKESLEITSIYERYGHLFSRDLAKNVLERWEKAETDEEHRTYKHLHQFAFFGFIGNLNKKNTETMAKRQNGMKINVGGEEIGYHSIFPRLKNESDAGLRREIDDKATELEVELNEIRLESWAKINEVFREFDYSSYREGCEKSSSIDYEWLKGELVRFLDETEEEYVESFDKLSNERLGYPISDAEKCDLAYLMRGEEWDSWFPKDGMVDKCTRFLSEMGMSPEKVPAVKLDVEEREKKRPRAFCAAVRPGEEVYVCLRPMGGMNDYTTFLHEMGHAYHFAHTDSKLPSELILIGDSATSEIYAFLFNYLPVDPVWLKTYLGIDDPSSFLEFQRIQKLYFLRRYASKFLYELELFDDYSIESRSGLYSKYLERGLKAKHREENWLNDLDPGFYSAGYLRAWIFEVQLRDWLKDQFGSEWWRSPKASEVLKENWRTGRMYMPEELSERICGCPLDLGPVKREVVP